MHVPSTDSIIMSVIIQSKTGHALTFDFMSHLIALNNRTVS